MALLSQYLQNIFPEREGQIEAIEDADKDQVPMIHQAHFAVPLSQLKRRVKMCIVPDCERAPGYNTTSTLQCNYYKDRCRTRETDNQDRT